MAKLVVLTEGFGGRVLELSTEKATVGRLDDNKFSLSEPSVSSHHCELTLKGERKDAVEEGVAFHRRERSIGQFELRL